MSRKKYVVDARKKINRHKTRQQKAKENLQTLLQETPTETAFVSFPVIFENIMLDLDKFVTQLAFQNPIDLAEVKNFMAERADELKKLHKTLPSTATATRRELRRYEKMVLAFPDKLQVELQKNQTAITVDITAIKDSSGPSRLRM